MHYAVSLFAEIGSFIIALCLVAASTIAVAICNGILLQQSIGGIFGVSDDWTVTNGLRSGAVGGFLISIVAIYELGIISGFLSMLGLCSMMLLTALVVWYLVQLPRVPGKG